MKKINLKALNYKVTLKGCGLINADGKEQKDRMQRGGYYNFSEHSNYIFAKKNFYDDGFKYKISTACLKRAFLNRGEIQAGFEEMTQLRIMYSTDPKSLLNGWVINPRNANLKRASCICLTDAEEVTLKCHNMAYFEFCQGDGHEETSIYYKENVGELTYQAKGGIDIEKLQFLITDDFYSRQAVNLTADTKEFFLECLEKNFPGFKPEIKYYIKKNTSTQNYLGEEGVMLSADAVDYMIKLYFKGMLSLTNMTTRAHAYMIFDSLHISCKDIDGEKYEFDIKDQKDLDEIYFNAVSDYEAIDPTLYSDRIKELKELKKLQKEERKKNKKKED